MHKGNQHIMEHAKFSEKAEIPAPIYKDLANTEFSKVVK